MVLRWVYGVVWIGLGCGDCFLWLRFEVGWRGFVVRMVGLGVLGCSGLGPGGLGLFLGLMLLWLFAVLVFWLVYSRCLCAWRIVVWCLVRVSLASVVCGGVLESVGLGGLALCGWFSWLFSIRGIGVIQFCDWLLCGRFRYLVDVLRCFPVVWCLWWLVLCSLDFCFGCGWRDTLILAFCAFWIWGLQGGCCVFSWILRLLL